MLCETAKEVHTALCGSEVLAQPKRENQREVIVLAALLPSADLESKCACFQLCAWRCPQPEPSGEEGRAGGYTELLEQLQAFPASPAQGCKDGQKATKEGKSKAQA